MIISEQSDFRRYASVNKHFSKVCDFLENTNLTDLVDGKIDIDGENVFANCMIYLADGVPGAIFETHKKYHPSFFAQEIRQGRRFAVLLH